jgi:hypothetical protein
LGVGVILGGIGVRVLYRRHKVWVVSLLLFFGAHALFFINYRVVDKELMFLPCYLVWTYFLGSGFAWLLHWAETVSGLKGGIHILWPLGLIIALCCINYTYVDLSEDDRARTQAQAFLDDAAPNALVVGWWTEITPLHYLQYVEGQRPDLLMINRLMISDLALRQLVHNWQPYGDVYLLQQSDAYPQRITQNLQP